MSNAVNCVKGEIHNVLSIMRANARWASEARFHHEIPLHSESPLLVAFKQLHVSLTHCVSLSDFDTVAFLSPFLQIIKSEKASGLITGVAVSSLNKFLLYEFVTLEGLRSKEAINQVASAVAKCRFEETHKETDEMVLMKLLELLEYTLRCPAGTLISGPNVWRMVQTCYRISQEPHSSVHLCHTAENTLAHLVLTVFNRIADLEDFSAGDNDDPPVVFSPTYVRQNSAPSWEDALREAEEKTFEDSSNSTTTDLTEIGEALEDDNDIISGKPYGIPVLKEILQFLSGMIDATVNDENSRILGLSLINIVLETGGSGLGAHASLVSVMQGDLSKFLLQNSESTDLTILSVTLRVVFNLFNSIKDHLKVQLEVFFTSVHMRIIDSPSCTDEQKELAMESLLEFCREPALMLDLYINYDCDVHCTNLFEVLCKNLARHAKSSTGVLNVLNLHAVEGLLAVVNSIANRCEPAFKTKTIASMKGTELAEFALPDGPEIMTSSVRDVMNLVMRPEGSSTFSDASSDSEIENGDWLHTARERTAEVMQQRKKAKKRLTLAAEKFNTDRKGWISYAQQLGLLSTPVEPEGVARFLLHTPGLNKTKVGEFLGDGPPDKLPFNEAVRNVYVTLFDFTGKDIDEALRMFLEKFRLPGEAQKIDRMMEAFSTALFQQSSKGPLANADAAFILSFSIIMLNTDLHNDQIMKKMTCEEFIRNNRGINDGKDLPASYLTDVYEKIRDVEIQMQHDLSSDLASVPSGTQWDGVLKRSQNVVGASFTSNASIRKLRAGLYEKEMFTIIADKTINALSTAFEQTSDPAVMTKVLDGLRDCAKIAVYFDLLSVLNQMVINLCKYFLQFASNVLSGDLFIDQRSENENYLSQEEMYTKRALVAIEFVFSLVHNYGNYFRDAWKDVVECILCMNELDVLPASMCEMDDFVDERGVPLYSAHNVPTVVSSSADTSDTNAPSPKRKTSTAGMTGKVRERSRRRAEKRAEAMQENSSTGGLWSSLQSFLLGDEEEDSTFESSYIHELIAEYVGRCGLEREQWVKFCKQLTSVSVTALLQALILARDPLRSTTQHATEANTGVDRMLEENAIFAIELSTDIALANQFRIEELWPTLHQYFERILHNHRVAGTDLPMTFLVERMVVNLLRVCVHVWHEHPMDGLLTKSLLLLNTLSPATLQALCERISFGIVMLVKANSMYIEDTGGGWDAIFQLLVSCSAYESGRAGCWDVLKFMVDSGNVSCHNYTLWTEFVMKFVDGFKPLHPRQTQISIGALQLLQQLARDVAGSSSSEADISVLNDRWLDLVQLLYSQLTHTDDAVARAAWDCIYATLILPGAILQPSTWMTCFDKVLFKLSSQVKKDDLWASSPEEGHLRCTAILSKAFLHNVTTLSKDPLKFQVLWLNVLRRLAADLSPAGSAGHNEILYETSIQLLHNIMMVMDSEGIFYTVSEGSSQDILELTWAVLDAICPQVREQIGPIGSSPPQISVDEKQVPEVRNTGDDASEQTSDDVIV